MFALGAGLADRAPDVHFDAMLRIERDLFADAGLSAEAVLASGGLRVSEKIALDAERGVDMSVWRAVRKTDDAGRKSVNRGSL